MDQTLLLNIGQLLLGILFLVTSGDYLVRGSVAIANHFKISSLVIGLTVVAFGTSAPELIVSLGAAVTGHPEIALGNVIGSNIANIALVLALTVIILPMPVAEQTIKRSWPFMFLAGLMLFAFMTNNNLTNAEGFVLFGLLIVFIISAIRSSHNIAPPLHLNKPANKHKISVYIIWVILASAGLAIGSKFLITGASSIATQIGISERIISITIVAFGTSIPELTASIIAAFKKQTDISVGNIVGSNIFNVFAVIGITSAIQPIHFKFIEFRVDLIFMILIYLILLFAILPFRSIVGTKGLNISERFNAIKGGNISRLAGILLVFLYVLYIFIIFKS